MVLSRERGVVRGWRRDARPASRSAGGTPSRPPVFCSFLDVARATLANRRKKGGGLGEPSPKRVWARGPVAQRQPRVRVIHDSDRDRQTARHRGEGVAGACEFRVCDPVRAAGRQPVRHRCDVVRYGRDAGAFRPTAPTNSHRQLVDRLRPVRRAHLPLPAKGGERGSMPRPWCLMAPCVGGVPVNERRGPVTLIRRHCPRWCCVDVRAGALFAERSKF